MEDNSNIVLSDEKGIFKVFEYKMNLCSKTPNEAIENYYMFKANIRKKQIFISLKEESVCINSGIMQYMLGNIKVKTNISGFGDFIDKKIASSLIGEELIKPKYYGVGYIMLQPTYQYIILEELKNNDKGIVISDGKFLACSQGIEIDTATVSTFSSASFGKEGIYNLLLKGSGQIAFTSHVPKQDITLIKLQNDVIKINGNYALAWSGNLKFTVETSSTDIFGSTVLGDSLVNVYRGTGTIWLANTLPDQ